MIRCLDESRYATNDVRRFVVGIAFRGFHRFSSGYFIHKLRTSSLICSVAPAHPSSPPPPVQTVTPVMNPNHGLQGEGVVPVQQPPASVEAVSPAREVPRSTEGVSEHPLRPQPKNSHPAQARPQATVDAGPAQAMPTTNPTSPLPLTDKPKQPVRRAWPPAAEECRGSPATRVAYKSALMEGDTKTLVALWLACLNGE